MLIRPIRTVRVSLLTSREERAASRIRRDK